MTSTLQQPQQGFALNSHGIQPKQNYISVGTTGKNTYMHHSRCMDLDGIIVVGSGVLAWLGIGDVTNDHCPLYIVSLITQMNNHNGMIHVGGAS